MSTNVMSASVMDRPDAAAAPKPFDGALTLRIQDFYFRYANTICDDQLEEWPNFFEDPCLYRIIPRANYDRNFPAAPMYCESRGALFDRVTAIRSTLVFAPRAITHHVTGIRILRQEGDTVQSRSAVSVYQTMVEGETRMLLIAKTLDSIRIADAGFQFVKRDVIYDTELLASALIHPV
jgi:3-phenylpropionate/cinnamic acid dioxygenase small subunit